MNRRIALVFALLAAPLALSACNGHDDGKASKISVSIDSDGSTTAASKGGVTIDSDTDKGKFQLSLPGGIDANISVPGGMTSGAHFDIDGVGLYPGAKVSTVNVNASHKGDGKSAVVKIGFAAAADPAAVADWYQTKFADKKVTVTRDGETLTGKTEDRNDFTLAMTPGAKSGTAGLLTIIDAKDS